MLSALLVSVLMSSALDVYVRVFPQGHETRKSPVYGPRAGENRRLWARPWDQISTAVHRLCLNSMVRLNDVRVYCTLVGFQGFSCHGVSNQVPSSRGAPQVHIIQFTHRPVGDRLHHGWALHTQASVPRIQWSGYHIQDLPSPGYAKEGNNWWKKQKHLI